jgi:ABC-type branched-subunit amino acid transport system substrate-binding protein
MKAFIWFLSIFLISTSFARAEISLGLLSELTGSGAPNGVSCREGYELARSIYAPNDQIQNNKIRFIFGDHRAQAQAGIAEYQRMVKQEEVIAVLSNRGRSNLCWN